MRLPIIILLGFALAACGSKHEGQPGDFAKIMNPQHGIATPYEVEGEPYTGMLYADWPDGQRRYEIELADGKPAGDIRRWNKSGTLVQDGEADPESHRMLRLAWYCDSGGPEQKRVWDGSIAMIERWDCATGHQVYQGRQDALSKYGVHKTWYAASGKLRTETHYQAKADRAPDDKLANPRRDGPDISYHPNGQMAMRVHYEPTPDKAFQADQKHGEETHWHDNGQVKLEANWTHGKQTGSAKTYYADGQLKSVAQFDDAGNKTGLWQTFDASGVATNTSDYGPAGWIDPQYAEPYFKALEPRRGESNVERLMYYINEGLVGVGDKLPTRSDGIDLDHYKADRWPKRSWTHAVIVAGDNALQPLLKAGAQINKADSLGRTRLIVCALQIAARDCDAVKLKAVVDAGADVTVVDNSGQSALHKITQKTAAGWNGAAWKKAQAQAVDVLIEAGAAVNARDADGYTPLMYALAERRDDLAQALLAADAEVTGANAKGHHPIHFVFMTDDRNISMGLDDFTRRMIPALVAKGADVRTPLEWNGKQVTLKDLAQQLGQVDLAKFLDAQ